MNQSERKMLAEAAVPLEVLCAQIVNKPYKEMTDDLQVMILEATAKIRTLLFDNPPNSNKV